MRSHSSNPKLQQINPYLKYKIESYYINAYFEFVEKLAIEIKLTIKNKRFIALTSGAEEEKNRIGEKKRDE